ncbi:unnamed protein product [Brachionus calyciflorus]|uniref:Uncharacterized protein n=1 Tax=Brachionus calyciflorus TaxID=104777 RepID=A0A813SN97_9BILA|nr:unnamed protein product [Brachionus calyciflorus]
MDYRNFNRRRLRKHFEKNYADHEPLVWRCLPNYNQCNNRQFRNNYADHEPLVWRCLPNYNQCNNRQFRNNYADHEPLVWRCLPNYNQCNNRQFRNNYADHEQHDIPRKKKITIFIVLKILRYQLFDFF